MLFEKRSHVTDFFFSDVDFSFSVHDIFLKIKSNCFGLTEIFHIVRHLKAHFFRQSEIMVNDISAGENNSSEFRKIDFLLSYVSCIDSFHLNKGSEIDLNFISFTQFVIRRRIVCRLRLGNKYGFYFHYNLLITKWLEIYTIRIRVKFQVHKDTKYYNTNFC